MTLEKQSPCKVNLILNILGRRADGFHELETILQPVPLFDHLVFRRTDSPGVTLTCNHPELPTDGTNLVVRSALRFFESMGDRNRDTGVEIHLDKRIPLSAGLAGGSANGAVTLAALNELFGHPLEHGQLISLAASLGSDMPFFLQDRPALAVGRGEKVTSLNSFPVLRGKSLLLVHPGFGISTAWAYKELARFPTALNGSPGRAEKLIRLLNGTDLEAAGREFYNSLEAPALEKYPILRLYQDFFRNSGAGVAMMSGSGSTTFAVFETRKMADQAVVNFRSRFGEEAWTAVVEIPG